MADYTESLKFLTAVLTFFQGRNVFTPQSSPRLLPSFERLVLELWPVPAGPYTPALRCYEAGPHRVQVDVSGPGSGHYELRSEATTFGFYADDYLAATGAWGLLVLTDQVLAAPPGTPYTLRFAARPAYWQYQVREPLPPAPAMFTIVGDTTGLDFEAVPRRRAAAPASAPAKQSGWRSATPCPRCTWLYTTPMQKTKKSCALSSGSCLMARLLD